MTQTLHDDEKCDPLVPVDDEQDTMNRICNLIAASIKSCDEEWSSENAYSRGYTQSLIAFQGTLALVSAFASTTAEKVISARTLAMSVLLRAEIQGISSDLNEYQCGFWNGEKELAQHIEQILE